MAVVHPVGKGFAARRARNHEVVDPDTLRGLRGAPRAAAVLEGADQLLLLGIHRDRRLLAALRRTHPPRDVAELRVAVGMLPAFARLDVALQAVAEIVQEGGDDHMTHVMAECFQRHGQRPRAQARPAQGRIGIARRRRLDQRLHIAPQRRVVIRRTLPASTGTARSLRAQRLLLRQFPQAAPNRRLGDPGRSRHHPRPAAPQRVGFRRGPDPTRPLRKHGGHRRMFRPEGVHRHGASVLGVRAKYTHKT